MHIKYIVHAHKNALIMHIKCVDYAHKIRCLCIYNALFTHINVLFMHIKCPPYPPPHSVTWADSLVQ